MVNTQLIISRLLLLSSLVFSVHFHSRVISSQIARERRAVVWRSRLPVVRVGRSMLASLFGSCNIVVSEREMRTGLCWFVRSRNKKPDRRSGSERPTGELPIAGHWQLSSSLLSPSLRLSLSTCRRSLSHITDGLLSRVRLTSAGVVVVV